MFSRIFPAAAIIIFLLFFASGAAVKAPCLEFANRTADLDTMIQGEIKETVFHFKNTGTADLVIDHTTSSCGCTSAFSTKKRILPDSGGTVTVTFNSTQFRGEKSKQVFVHSNNPAKPIDTLTITVFVKSEIDCEPRNVFLYYSRQGVAQEKTVYLVNPGEKPITVVGFVPSEKFVKVKWKSPRTLNQNDTFPVAMEITPPDSDVQFSASVAIITKGGKTSHPFSIRVMGVYK